MLKEFCFERGFVGAPCINISEHRTGNSWIRYDARGTKTDGLVCLPYCMLAKLLNLLGYYRMKMPLHAVTLAVCVNCL